MKRAASFATALGVLAGISCAHDVGAASFPPGVTYPLKPAALQPSGLAQPLPSTRRYALVWKDQMIPDAYSDALKTWVVTHYVGTQKLFQRQIDDYRTKNPNFLMLVYHLSFGLNMADAEAMQYFGKGAVGNITAPNTFGQEDTDTFTPWVTANNANREAMYQHYDMPESPTTRVGYPDPYWLMDVSSTDWQTYLITTLLQWAAFPTAKATGIFFDVGFPPWYNYTPANWWTKPAGGATRQDLDNWWMPRAGAYFDALRTAFAPTAQHPRYLVVPNPDSLEDNTDEPTFLDHTDGVFTENWQGVADGAPGDWNLDIRRVSHYVTSKAKVWMIDITVDADSMSTDERTFLAGSYFLVRNGTSYWMIGGGDLTWWPEYEVDLGGYSAEPPDDVEMLRVAGTGGSSGGLYARQYVAGWVLVNSSSSPQSWMVPSDMKKAALSGGGAVGSDGTQAAQTLTWTDDVPAGPITLQPMTAVFLRDPNGPPPPGQEPGDTSDGGTGGDASGGDGGGGDSGVMTGRDDSGTGDDGGNGGNGAQPGGSGGCGCIVAGSDTDGPPRYAAAALCAIALLARSARPRKNR
jgi:hypothetical protein